MITDDFGNDADTVYAPARRAAAVTPDDDTPLGEVPKALYIGTGGTIAMRGVDGDEDQIWANVPSGSILPFRAVFVRATSTTAADILALY